MNFNLLAALTAFAASALFPQTGPKAKSDVQPQWQTIDQLCGQLELAAPKKKRIIVDGKPEIRLHTAYLEGATVTLYPGASGDKECCDAEPLASTQSRKYGAFEFEGVQPGDYWFRVKKNALIRLIPVRLTQDFDKKACNSASVGRSTKVDSIPPKIEIRIR